MRNLILTIEFVYTRINRLKKEINRKQKKKTLHQHVETCLGMKYTTIIIDISTTSTYILDIIFVYFSLQKLQYQYRYIYVYRKIFIIPFFITYTAIIISTTFGC